MVMAATYQVMRSGNMQVTYLPDGYFLFNPRVLFPGTSMEDWQNYQDLLNPDGQLVGSIGAYLIQMPDHTILVDTGYGPRSVDGMVYSGKLLVSMALAGVEAADVDIVFLTHLHSDHVGWVGKGESGLTFFNARHLLRREEWNRFENPAEKRNGVEDALRLLGHRVECVGTGEQIAPGITIIATPGHTMGHSSLLITTTGEERIIILGDIFHSVAQFEHPEWVNAMDSNHELAKHTRELMLQELAKPSTIGVGTHLSQSVFGQLTLHNGKSHWQLQI